MNEWLPDIAAYEMSLDVATERGKQLHKKITIKKRNQKKNKNKTKKTPPKKTHKQTKLKQQYLAIYRE